MNLKKLKETYINKKFIILYITIFIILFIFFSFIKFLGQLPMLMIIAFVISYYTLNYFGSNVDSIVNQLSDDQKEDYVNVDMRNL
jgi:hypothetical protein